MANKRYEPIKRLLYEGFLTEKQQYLLNVLVMKRHTANFIGTTAGNPKRQQQHQPKSKSSGVLGDAFVQPEKRKKKKGPFPYVMCVACNMQHDSSWESCN